MSNDAEPTLRDVVRVLRRGLLPALLTAIAVGVAVAVLSGQRTPQYQAQATVVTTTQDPGQRGFGATLVTAPALATATYRAAALNQTVLTDAWQTLEGRSPTELELTDFRESLTVRSEDAPASSLLRISALAPEPSTAKARADAVAAALVRWDIERATRALESILAGLEAQIEAIDAEIEAATAAGPDEAAAEIAGLERARADLVLQRSSARALRSGAVGRVELFETATEPLTPHRPRPLRDGAFAAVLGLMVAFGVVLLSSGLDGRVRDLDDLVAVTGLPVLAVFPRVRGGRTAMAEEAANYLRTAVSFAAAHVHPKIVMVTSDRDGQGASSVAIALAQAFARQDHRTALVDADLRNPVLAAAFDLRRPGYTNLPDALSKDMVLRPARVRIGSEQWLDVFPTFQPVANPAELLSARFGELLEVLTSDYDIIVVDSAPVLPVADSLVIGPHTVGVVFASSMASANRRSVRSALALLRRVDVHLLGVVATHISAKQPDVGAHGYGYVQVAARRTTADA